MGVVLAGGVAMAATPADWPVEVTYLGTTGAVIAAKTAAIDGDTILYVQDWKQLDDPHAPRASSSELRVPRGREPDGVAAESLCGDPSLEKDFAQLLAACADRSETSRADRVCPGMIESVAPRSAAPRLALCFEMRGRDSRRALYRREASGSEWTPVTLDGEIRGIAGVDVERAYAWSSETVYWTSNGGRDWTRIARSPSRLEIRRDGGTDSQGRLLVPLTPRGELGGIDSVLFVDGARRRSTRRAVGFDSDDFAVVDGGFVATIEDEEAYVDELTRFECGARRCRPTHVSRLANTALGLVSDGGGVLVAEVLTQEDDEATTYFTLPRTVLLSRDGGRTWIQGPSKQAIREIVPVGPGSFVVLRDMVRIESWNVSPGRSCVGPR